MTRGPAADWFLPCELCKPSHASRPSDVTVKEAEVDLESHLSDSALGPVVLPVPWDDASFQQASTALSVRSGGWLYLLTFSGPSHSPR